MFIPFINFSLANYQHISSRKNVIKLRNTSGLQRDKHAYLNTSRKLNCKSSAME